MFFDDFSSFSTRNWGDGSSSRWSVVGVQNYGAAPDFEQRREERMVGKLGQSQAAAKIIKRRN